MEMLNLFEVAKNQEKKLKCYLCSIVLGSLIGLSALLKLYKIGC